MKETISCIYKIGSKYILAMSVTGSPYTHKIPIGEGQMVALAGAGLPIYNTSNKPQ